MRLVIILLFLLVYLPLHSQTKKALIIGIDMYKPEGIQASNTTRSVWNNLDGCVNDANAMKDLVISRYAFDAGNINFLTNEQASRENILKSLEKLVSEAKKGDVIFIYYAGHGSQVYNSLSSEADKRDETMVPADAYKGAADIRDKELAVYFNKLLDKGVLLTVIFDSCHSGSVGRGDAFLNEPPKVRYIEENKMDVKDPSDPVRPESRGALMFSAAQDFEFAKEQRDENNIPHGAFTIALLKTLQQLSPDAPVSNIHASVTAIMKYYGKTQEPVLAANEERINGTLFGLEKGAIKNQFTIGVSKKDSKGVELLGGYAFGLSEGVRLASISTNDTLEVIEMRGANKSYAKSLNGSSSDIQPGTLFEVISWASAKSPALKIYLPAKGLDDKQLMEEVSAFQALRTSKKTKWIYDLTKSSPQRIFSLTDGNWIYYESGEKKIVGKKLNATAVAQIQSAAVNFPPSVSMVNEIKKAFSQYNNISIVSDPSQSQYSLVGTVDDAGNISYALVKTHVTVQDTTESFPARTDFVEYKGSLSSATSLAASLSEYAFRIAKIRDWLMLSSPPGGTSKFPFKLSFQYYTSEKELTSDKVNVNDTLSIYFQRDPSMGSWNRRQRYVYVFSIDSKGFMNLLFPNAESGNVENRLPYINPDKSYEQRSHIADILITPPAGADNYFLLSSEEAIGNLSAFQQEGVITRGPVGPASKPLEGLLFTGTKTRNKVITPVTWSIQKIVLRTFE